ncbi:T9SS C-terminal target domain-containing protein [Chryseotalea sanaruensis]|uniref:T9SS C-terminal target domain-containing protein n=1 Tax=Chryseotalea sanaruensis TaxID=2482724 RepID=A0A401UE18_9BACT|nr:alpha/beta hydrolase-fold protein [Chryseotalea sanaruensis]GCC53139.1 T9SS C-terminal target domain-containing protein [Chryseotalea sanaruensis]
MRISICLLFLCGLTAQAQPEERIHSILKALKDPATQEANYNFLTSQHKIPYVVDDSALFLFQGKANEVKWMGDFNAWGYTKSFPNTGIRIPNTDIWFLKASFPKDARLDYKIVIDNNQWILDPVNPNHQWSGVGGGSPNSELRMPDWKADDITLMRDEVPQGKMIRDVLVNSKQLSYQLMYSVYLPPNFSSTKSYPVLYVTDGFEYLHENMGNIITTLNNLLHQKKIEPIIAVFIDHREPANRLNNRRMTELAMNENYLNFFVDEFLPIIEGNYPVSKKPEERGILGTSMGGLTAAYFSFSRPDVFGLAGIQSPAFWFKPAIYTTCDNPEKPPVKVFMTTGTVNDAQEGALKMKAILDKNTCNYQYKEVSEGHSWGNWRNLLDDILIYFYPAKG